MMASIGYLLLHWGAMERRLADEPFPPELAAVRQLRNTLCHGLRSAWADPNDDAEPHVCCQTANGEDITYTWIDLDEAIRTLERFNNRRM